MRLVRFVNGRICTRLAGDQLGPQKDQILFSFLFFNPLPVFPTGASKLEVGTTFLFFFGCDALKNFFLKTTQKDVQHGPNSCGN